jgi:PAS domain S-box-containing protein
MANDKKVVLGGIILSLIFFALDLSIELGVAGGVPYVAVVLLGLLSDNKKYFIIFGISGVLLTIAGYLLSPIGGEMWKVLLNRFYAIFAILSTSYICHIANRTKEQLRDLNKQRVLEAKLRIEQSKSQAILENVVDGIITIDEKGLIRSFNPASERIFGYSKDEVLGENIKLLMPEPYHSEHDRYLNAYLTSGVAKIINIGREVEGLRKDKTIFSLELAISETSVGDDRLFTGIVRDISERKSFENALKVAKVDAEAANKAKSNFLANMSHEIRTPMNAILGYAQVLSRDDTLNDDQKESIGTINKSGNHLLGLINDILDISKIESGQIDLKPVDFDLGLMSNDLKKMFQVRCDEKNLHLNIKDCIEGDALLHGDESKIRQILINLIGNAVKFTDYGEIEFKFTKLGEGHQILFEIFDTGRGIPLDAQNSIFEPFKQDREGMRKGGTGLGLSISKKHVAKMGGELKVESKISEGSRFYFTIPLHPSKGLMDNLHGKYKNVRTLKKGCQVKALVIDDVKENRNVLAKFLNDINVSAIKGKNGEEAVDKVKTEDPHIVFLDIHMPVMDGVEAFHEIKKRYKDKDIKLVCITASAFGEQLNEYLKLGFDAFISKPFKTEEILSVLENLLNVEYDYKKDKPKNTLESDFKKLNFSEIQIPQELKDRILKHARLYNVSYIKKDTEEIKILDGEGAKPLADYLNKCLKTYDMASIINSVSKLS